MNIIAIMTAVLLLLGSTIGHCAGEASYDETVSTILKTMAGSTSEARKESYNYIRIDKCTLEYNVLGTFPSGGLYNIKYSGLDFSGLKYQGSKAGHDYTAFVTLNFKNDLHAKDGSKDLAIRTIVVNVSDDAGAQVLYQSFLQLGELCGAFTLN